MKPKLGFHHILLFTLAFFLLGIPVSAERCPGDAIYVDGEIQWRVGEQSVYEDERWVDLYIDRIYSGVPGSGTGFFPVQPRTAGFGDVGLTSGGFFLGPLDKTSRRINISIDK
ncbi:hypothetical protein BVX98_01015, partial [bacterium F11]